MTEHKNIQNPEDYNEEDYILMESKLLSRDTDKSELEEICMTLAHLPTKKAQEILAKFRETERAGEVGWLDIAMDEGQFHYLSPQTGEEERDFLALKVMQELEDEIVELEVKYDEYELEFAKAEIKHEAVLKLIEADELSEDADLGYADYKTVIVGNMEELQRKIEEKEKIFEQIKNSIKSVKYKDLDIMYMRNVGF